MNNFLNKKTFSRPSPRPNKARNRPMTKSNNWRNRRPKPTFRKMRKPRDIEKEEIKVINGIRTTLAEVNPSDIISFELLPICNKTLQGLSENGYEKPTKVQRQTLIHSLQGVDVVAAAKTGSGKTLAFIIPLLEHLYLKMWNVLDGLGALIITPTRELAYQIFEVINKVGKMHTFSVGLVIGGKDLKHEWSRIQRCNILICTPGRLLQHMTQNPEFESRNVQLLILDEADHCLSLGFVDTMNLILQELPTDRQTLLFSATQTKEVEDLIRSGVRDPVFCSVHENSKTATPKTLTESYLVINDHDKLNFLFSYLKHHMRKKILIFVATCKQVVFLKDLFTKLFQNVGYLTFYGLHGHVHQLKRMSIYDEFCLKNHAVLFATDVAARGLDFPHVDYVLQVDCPEDVKTYIHRAGRTARYANHGESILSLTPSQETPMIANLESANIHIEKISVDPNKMLSMQTEAELKLSKYLDLKEKAERAFKSYVKNIAIMKDRKVFDFTTIDMDAFSRSFGLPFTPIYPFIEKKLKKRSVKCETKTGNIVAVTHNVPVTLKKTSNIGIDDDMNKKSENDFLKLATQKPLEELQEKSEDLLKDFVSFANSNKGIDKYKVAKQLAKGNINLNKRLVFNEEDESGSIQVNDGGAAKVTGINISEFQEQLKSQDQIDKENARVIRRKILEEKKKKQKRREKEEAKQREKEAGAELAYSDSDNDLDAFTQNIIDELPDPDGIYDENGAASETEYEDSFTNNKRHGSSADSEIDDSFDDSENEGSFAVIESEGCASDIEEKTLPEKQKAPSKTKRKFWGEKRAKKEALMAKRARLEAQNDLSVISCTEKEDLAMLLLQRKH